MMETKGSEEQDICIHISSVKLLSHVQLFVTPWTAARQASASLTPGAYSNLEPGCDTSRLPMVCLLLDSLSGKVAFICI